MVTVGGGVGLVFLFVGVGDRGWRGGGLQLAVGRGFVSSRTVGWAVFCRVVWRW